MGSEEGLTVKLMKFFTFLEKRFDPRNQLLIRMVGVKHNTDAIAFSE